MKRPLIAIVDYGMGNLRSVEKAFQCVDGNVKIVSDSRSIEKADKVVVPGVGAFNRAMQELRRRKLISPILKKIKSGRPYLGICLGMQLLYESSEEEGPVAGLGVLKGKVIRFRTRLKVPHIGWNSIQLSANHSCPLLAGIPNESSFYFVHSYYVAPKDKSLTVGTTDYEKSFTSVIWKDRIFATQFHPEKSQSLGLKILDNFVRLPLE